MTTRAHGSTLAAAAARQLRRAARVLERAGRAEQTDIVRTMRAHDMVAHPDEGYYLEQYIHWLRPTLNELKGAGARVVDLGCGQGRLALGIAEELPDSAVTGIDVVPDAIAAATAYAAQRGLRNVTFEVGDGVAAARTLSEDSIDLVLFTEVSFWLPEYRDVLEAGTRALRPGGIFFTSLRSQYHDLLSVVQARNLEGARTVRDRRSGQIHDGPLTLAWHTTADVRREFKELGLDLETLVGIGVVSGLPSDPHGSIVSPSALSEAERADLLELELSLAAQYADVGRYIVAVGRKQPPS
jgi:2-polyprenyl-3-methyl-5-hydroxy-6-metoxy-1,4-benzoquinol methylase